MKFSKAIPVAAVVAMAFAQMPAFADGLAYKYPVAVPKSAVEAPPVAVAPGAASTGAAVVKPPVAVPEARPIGPASVWDAATANISTKASPAASPAAAAATTAAATSAAPIVTSPERKGISQWMVSRYEPLSEKDSAEAVPDLNRRGHGGGGK